MNESQVRQITIDLLKQHDLYGKVTLKFGSARSQLGSYRAGHRNGVPVRIFTVSMALALVNSEEELRDTVLHEIAHAIAGISAGHGPEWKSVARRIGATPKATARRTNAPEPRYRATCTCGQSFKRERLAAGKRYCTPCYNKGLREELVWVHTTNFTAHLTARIPA